MVRKTTTLSPLLFAIIALVGALGCAGGGSPALPGTDNTTGGIRLADGVLSGTLTDPNGNPLAWAELYVDGEIAGWTGEDGSFTIYGVDGLTDANLEARIDGETIYSTSIGSTRTVQGEGNPTVERGKVFGFVADQKGPVPHALVVVFNKDENYGVDFSDEKGYYEIPDAPAGLCMIIGFAPQHAVAKDKVFVIANGEVQKNLFLPAKLDFGQINGIVVTGPKDNPKPIPMAQVWLEPIGVPGSHPINTFTNKFGAYVFPKIPMGPHKMLAGAPCFNQQPQALEVHPGQNIVNFHLEPVPCGGVEGSVKDPKGMPIVKALVRISHPSPDPGKPPFVIEMGTNEFGFYKFPPVLPGKYLLECMKPGFKPFAQDINVYPDQATVVDIILKPK